MRLCGITHLINEKNDEGKTPLHIACKEGRTESALDLILAGAYPSCDGSIGSQPFPPRDMYDKKLKMAKDFKRVSRYYIHFYESLRHVKGKEIRLMITFFIASSFLLQDQYCIGQSQQN